MTLGQEVAHGNCTSKHSFHFECIARWGKHSFFCPICRELYLHDFTRYNK
jgi:hypothetical protein